MPIDLDAIEERANAATPGPLVVVPCGVDDLGWDIDTPAGDFPAGIRGAFGRLEDAAFHAHAPDDVPALVARVREAESEVRRLRQVLRTIVDECSDPYVWHIAHDALAPEGGA